MYKPKVGNIVAPKVRPHSYRKAVYDYGFSYMLGANEGFCKKEDYNEVILCH